MLRLAGAIADGVKLNWLPASIVPALIQDIRAGAEDPEMSRADVESDIGEESGADLFFNFDY